MTYDWDFNLVYRYREVLIHGLLTTLLLNVLVIALGTFGGALLAGLGLSRFRVLRLLVAIYSELFRALPILVIIIWMFYCLPLVFGQGWKLDAYGTAVVALSLNLAAGVGEVIRAGFLSTSREPIDAAYVLGLRPWHVFWHVRLPLAWRRSLPALMNQYAYTVKQSALASAIAVPELLYQSSALISITYRPLEFYTMVALGYLILLLPMTLGSRWAERYYATT